MKESRLTPASYITGYILSIIITICSFGLVFLYMNSPAHIIPQVALIAVILILAVGQLMVQLMYFMHLLGGKGQGWRQAIFLSTISIVLIIILGSIWIMNNLNYNMTPDQIMQYTNDQSGL